MDHKRISKLLKKIGSLNKSIEEDGEFSSIEKEHMLSYLRKLFEEVNGEIPDDLDVQTEEKAQEPIAAPVIEEVVPEQVVVIEEEEEPIAVEEEEPVVAQEENEFDGVLLSLFDDKTGNDLSDKLASTPIKDLTKAMGINERIFTINELFGGNKEEFENTMSALDGLDSFEEAKKVLMGSVATKYAWSDEQKLKKASGFIKVVRRRFN